METSWRPDISKTDKTTLSACISNAAYMDDTVWITDSQDKLTNILDISHTFFELNSMKVNFDKSVIIPSRVWPATLSFQSSIDNTCYSIPTLQPHESTRYLGVWISAQYNKHFVKKQIGDEISTFCEKLKRKSLTDKQLLYLNNMVLIPRLEYRSQLIVFSLRENDELFRPARKLYKQKLCLNSTIPNSTLSSKLTYGFNDLSSNATQSKVQKFLNIINLDPSSSILGLTTTIRLKQIQESFWLPDNPLQSWPRFNKNLKHDNFFCNMITMYFSSNFQFVTNAAVSAVFKIQGGSIPLSDIIPWNVPWITALKIKNILFLSQLSTSGLFLLEFRDLYIKNFLDDSSRKAGCVPGWFKSLQQKVLQNPVHSN